MKFRLRVLLSIALVVAAGPATAQVNCEAGIKFYANGGIKSCVLTGYHHVYTHQGVSLICAHGTVMVLHPDGALKSCTLYKTKKFKDRQCPAKSKVEFDQNGRLLDCRAG